MKHIVITEHLSCADIRPPGSLARLRSQSLEDSERFFGDAESLEATACPACDSASSDFAFEKHGFTYRLCGDCGSLYVSPRPTAEALRRYYKESEASRIRISYFTEASANARMRLVIESRVDWIAPFLGTRMSGPTGFLDVATIYPLLFTEMRKLDRFTTYHSADAAEQVVEVTSGDDVCYGWPESETTLAATAFEQLEHQTSPAEFIRRIRECLGDGCLLFLTTRTVSGFDLQVLWEATPYIFIPEHLNLLSIDGLEILFDREGFELLELSTPGQLDVEFVREAAKENEKLELPRFVRSLLAKPETELADDFQAFLQKYRLSSHVRVAARRRG